MGFVKKIGKGIGKVASGAFKGVKKLGGLASKAAPLLGLIPGVGTIPAGLAGLGGGLLSGENIGESLKRGLLGAGGGFVGGKLGGAPGIISKLGGLVKGGGQQEDSFTSGKKDGLQAVFEAAKKGKVPGTSDGGGKNIFQKLGDILGFGGGGQGGGGVLETLLPLLVGGGATAASLIGSGKDRAASEAFNQAQLDLQRQGLGLAEKTFAEQQPLRQAAFGKLQSALAESPTGIFSTSAERGKPAGFLGGPGANNLPSIPPRPQEINPQPLLPPPPVEPSLPQEPAVPSQPTAPPPQIPLSPPRRGGGGARNRQPRLF